MLNDPYFKAFDGLFKDIPEIIRNYPQGVSADFGIREPTLSVNLAMKLREHVKPIGCRADEPAYPIYQSKKMTRLRPDLWVKEKDDTEAFFELKRWINIGETEKDVWRLVVGVGPHDEKKRRFMIILNFDNNGLEKALENLNLPKQLSSHAFISRFQWQPPFPWKCELTCRGQAWQRKNPPHLNYCYLYMIAIELLGWDISRPIKSGTIDLSTSSPKENYEKAAEAEKAKQLSK